MVADRNDILSELRANLARLQVEQGQHADGAPPELREQIKDHQTAIELTEQALAGELSQAQWLEALASLDLPIDVQTGDTKSGVTIGDVGGDVRDSTMAGRDVVGRDKVEAQTYIQRATFVTTAPEAEPSTDEAPAPGEPPFKGLRYFDVADADWFFGREALTATLVGQLRQHRFLAVVGASGSGKSSLVRAGLIPALQRGEPLADGTHPPQASPDWPVHIITPTAQPLKELAASLTREAESVRATTVLMDDLAADARSLDLAVHRLLSQSSARRLLLVVDQFEELFTLCRSDEERRAFINNLLTAAGAPTDHEDEVWAEGPTIVVLTLRADFYVHCAQFDQLREALAKRQSYIGPMSAEELRRAIEEPARRGKWEFGPGLVDLLLRDVGEEPGALPLFSHALLETWQRRAGRRLTLKGYQAAGGVHGAIAKTAETVYGRLKPEQQSIARSIFLRLIELGEGTQDTRRRVYRSELYPAGTDAETIDAVLQALSGKEARLIVADEETVEVTHEALIQQWGQLREWLEENRDSLRLHRRVTEAAKEWQANERDDSYLFVGARLAEVETWVADHGGALTPEEWAFVSASIAEREREAQEEEERRQKELAQANQLREEAEARQQAEAERSLEAERRVAEQAKATKRLRRLLVGLALLFLIAVGVTLYALQQQNTATARQLVARSELAKADHETRLAILLALEAARLNSEDGNRQLTELATQLQSYNAIQLTPEHLGIVWAIAWSPDGRYLASGSSDGSVVIWEVETGQTQRLTEHKDVVTSVAWSPDGRFLASGSGPPPPESGRLRNRNDPTRVVIWEVATGQTQRLTEYLNKYSSLAWSPDSRFLAWGTGLEVEMWEAATGQTQRLHLSYTSVYGVGMAWSPDSRFLASDAHQMSDSSVVIWEVETGQIQRLPEQTDWIETIAWSPDGRYLASGSRDNSVVIWEAETGQTQRLTDVSSLAWSPDGRYLASGSDDNRVVIWEVGTWQTQRLTEHTSAVRGVAWSPDGRYVASWSGTSLVIWETETGKIQHLSEHPAPVSSVAWSPIIPQNKHDIALAYAVGSEVRLLQEAFIHPPCEWGMLTNLDRNEIEHYLGSIIFHQGPCPNLRNSVVILPQ